MIPEQLCVDASIPSASLGYIDVWPDQGRDKVSGSGSGSGWTCAYGVNGEKVVTFHIETRRTN
jgi:hypothetical protein